MCIICREHLDFTVPYLGTELAVLGCPFLTALPPLPNVVKLECFSCPRLQSLPVLPNVLMLDCAFCPLLTALPEMPRLQNLHCASCTSLEIIPSFPELRLLDCDDCTSLKSIPALPQIEVISCRNCRMLLTITNHVELFYGNCPWLSIHPTFQRNLRALRCLQRYLPRRKLWRFVKLTRSRDFNESFFAPEGLGGQWHKKAMLTGLC